MKKLLIGLVSVLVALHAYRLLLRSPASAQEGSCGNAPAELCCHDANGDGTLDLSDPIYVLSWLFSGGPAPRECHALGSDDDEAFRRQVAGVYLAPVRVQGIQVYDMITVTGDGNFLLTKTNDFGQGNLPANGFQSPEHGAWEYLGGGRIATTSLAFVYDAKGLWLRTLRVRGTLTFSDLQNGKYQGFTGEFALDAFNAGQDPSREEPAAPTFLTGSFGGNRLAVR